MVAVTRHAIDRWTTRLRKGPDPLVAVQGAFLRSVVVPRSKAGHLVKPAHRNRTYRVTAAAVLVCRGQRLVITVVRLQLEELASVLCWLMLGRWV